MNASELNKQVLENIQITSQENMILRSMESFYLNKNNIDFFINIISVESDISIRLIDYFVTKYSKIHKISYKYDNETINIFTSYKQQLKAFQKKHFDPFSRGERIPYFMGSDCVITTIGQLNFFRWFISKNILNYITTNQLAIENNMNFHNNDSDKSVYKPLKTLKTKKIKYTPIINKTIINEQPKQSKIIVSFR